MQSAQYLRVLGPQPGLFVSDVEEAGPSLSAGKPYAALCLIALSPGGVTREDLASLLWPHAVPERARASVRQALHVLRKALSGDALADDAGILTLPPKAVTSDVSRLDAAIAGRDLETAHALWGGGPFSHFSLTDAPAFNRWADDVRSRYEERLGRALTERAEQAKIQGSLDDAMAWLERGLQVRPYDERMHAERIGVLIELGLLDEAEQAVEWAGKIVEGPTDEPLNRLHERLWALRRAEEANRDPTSSHPVLPFVGRTSQMASLRSYWRTVLTGRPRSVAILGEPGVGKTRLVSEFIGYAIGSEAAVVRIDATDAERTLQFGGIVELVKALSPRPGGAGITNASLEVFRRLIPSLGNGTDPQQGPPPSEVSLADAVTDLVEAVSNEAPLVLYVDNFQWLDAGSRTLWLRVARSVRSVPVLFLATCRSGAPGSSALKPLVEETRVRRLGVLDLKPLELPETQECLGYALRVEPEGRDEHVARKLYASSRGNPLFLAALVAGMQRDGIIEKSGSEWICHANRLPDTIALPPSVWETLASRLAELDTAERTVVAALAFQDAALTLTRVAHITGTPEAELARAVPHLVETGLVSSDRDGGLALRYDALREVARATLPEPEHKHGLPGTMYLGWGGVLVAVVLALLWAFRPSAAKEAAGHASFGGGLIYYWSGGAVLRVRPPSRHGESWRPDTVVSLPGVNDITAMWQGPEGQLRLLEGYTAPSGKADTREVLSDGSTRELVGRVGDVNPKDISPAGRYALLTVAHHGGARWALDLAHLSLRDKKLNVVRPLGLGSARWLADGSGILAWVDAQPDTLLLLRPDGRTLWSQAFSSASGLGDACALGSDEFVVPSTSPGRLPDLAVLGPGRTTTIIPAEAPLQHGVQCSPAGEVVAYLGLVDGESRLVLQDLSTGDTLVGPAGIRHILRWKAEPSPATPIGIRVAVDTLRLEWGQRSRLKATVRFSDGSDREDTLVQWSSLDPRVAYASEGGFVFGNGGGRTEVVASVHGWLRDTVEVFVSAEHGPSGALLADRFTSFDTTRWTTVGSPTPRAVSVPDGPALDMRGDGIGGDGIQSRRAFDLSTGATLELEYRMPLTRRDRQSIQVCLQAKTEEQARGYVANGGRAATASDAVCFQHPVGELSAFDPTTFIFGSLVAPGGISRPDLFPSPQWRDLAIVLAPDGRGRLLIDRREVAELPLPAAMRPGERWYVMVLDRAADTRVMIRDLVLWKGMRY